MLIHTNGSISEVATRSAKLNKTTHLRLTLSRRQLISLLHDATSYRKSYQYLRIEAMRLSYIVEFLSAIIRHLGNTFCKKQSVENMQIFIKTQTGKIFVFYAVPSNTIEVIKTKIHNKAGLSIAEQLLMFEGKELEDEHTFSYYHIKSESRLHLVQGLRGCREVSTENLDKTPHAADVNSSRTIEKQEFFLSGEYLQITCKKYSLCKKANTADNSKFEKRHANICQDCSWIYHCTRCRVFRYNRSR